MIPALRHVPFVDGHVACRAFLVLFKLLAVHRMALVAAFHPVAEVEEPCPLVADSAPPGLAISESGIRAVGLDMAVVAAAEAFHLKFRILLFCLVRL
jgi:hypothetical protein